MRLTDKVILVTGSTTGIGLAIATRAIAEGAKVLLHGRDEPRARQAAAALGPAARFHIDDLADPAAPARIIRAAIDAFGRLDALVNNAAFVVRSDLASTDVTLFDKVMAVNVRAPMLLTQAALPHLQVSAGCVLNIGSMNYFCGERNLLAYSVSKGALVTLTRNLGDWLHRSHNIRVNLLNIGWTLTEQEYQHKIADGLPPDWPDKIPTSVLPTGKLARPEQIAAGTVYWLSEESRPMSGCIVDLDQYPVVGHIPFVEIHPKPACP